MLTFVITCLITCLIGLYLLVCWAALKMEAKEIERPTWEVLRDNWTVVPMAAPLILFLYLTDLHRCRENCVQDDEDCTWRR